MNTCCPEGRRHHILEEEEAKIVDLYVIQFCRPWLKVPHNTKGMFFNAFIRQWFFFMAMPRAPSCFFMFVLFFFYSFI